MPSVRRSAWSRFVAVVEPYFQRQTRRQAVALVVFLVAIMLGRTLLDWCSGRTSGNFTTALTHRETTGFVWFGLSLLGLFGVCAVAGGFKRFAEERLALRWRERLTRHLLDRYLSNRTYYRLNSRRDIDNPDQRIADDVRIFTTTALSFLIMGSNSLLQLVIFSGTLWAISPRLFLAAVVYACFGTVSIIFLGKRLVAFDMLQLKKEADFRFDLIQVRTHAEPIALLHAEADEGRRLKGRLGAVVDNMLRITVLNRNTTFFIEYFKLLIPLVPVLVVGPLVLRGELEYGKVVEAGIAFAFVVNAFSLIVDKFQDISAFGAVVERLGAAWGAFEEEGAAEEKSMIEIDEDEGLVAYDGLTLVTPGDGRLVLRNLSLEVPEGRRLLIAGPPDSGRRALLQATAGLWTAGQGRITRPPLDEVMFLPQQPHLPAGTLRDVLRYAVARKVGDRQVLAILEDLGFEEVLDRVGGLDAERDWPKVLSLGEQQIVGVARLLLATPRFAFLDEATSGLDPARAAQVYDVLLRSSITYITVASDPCLADQHDLVLEVFADGAWELTPETGALAV